MLYKDSENYSFRKQKILANFIKGNSIKRFCYLGCEINKQERDKNKHISNIVNIFQRIKKHCSYWKFVFF